MHACMHRHMHARIGICMHTQVCDEFLVCNQCRKMRQQLRVWNKFQEVMLDDLKHPVVLRSVDLLSDCIVGH